jgi:hypothetical protein
LNERTHEKAFLSRFWVTKKEKRRRRKEEEKRQQALAE